MAAARTYFAPVDAERQATMLSTAQSSMKQLESLADAAGEAVQEAWEARQIGGTEAAHHQPQEFGHVLSIAGETIIDYAALEGRAAPLADYAKLLSARQPPAAEQTPFTGEFGDAIGGRRPGRTAGSERVYPNRGPSALAGSPTTDLYTERPIDDDAGPQESTARPSRSARQAPSKAASSRQKVAPERSTARSHAAREQAALDNERDALNSKAAYRTELNAVRRNVAADRAALQAAERKMQAASRQVGQLKEEEESAAAAAAAAQRELAVERQMRSKAEARARVLSQKLEAASKAKARNEAKARAQEREKTLAAKRETRRVAKGPSRTKATARTSAAKRSTEPRDARNAQAQTQAEDANELKWGALDGPAPRQQIEATIPTATAKPVTARQRASEQEARSIERIKSNRPSLVAEDPPHVEGRKPETTRSAYTTGRQSRCSRKPSGPVKSQPHSSRAAEQEARSIERLRASAQDRAAPQADYEYMPEGPPRKKPIKKKKTKKWPKPKPIKSRPLPDWSAVPPKVSTFPDSQPAQQRAAAAVQESEDDHGVDAVPTPERVMRRALEQEERTVTRLRTRRDQRRSVDDNAVYAEPTAAESKKWQRQRQQEQQKRSQAQKNYLARGTHEERLAAKAEDARQRAARYKSAVNRLSSIAQAVDDVEREQAAERQRNAREKDNGVNARDRWRSAGPVRLDPDGCIILDGPEMMQPLRPRARSAPARSRPDAPPPGQEPATGVQPQNTSPPGYIKRMQQREMKAKASRPVGIAAWKHSLRDTAEAGGASGSDGLVGPRTNWLRKGGGLRAADGKHGRRRSARTNQPQFDDAEEYMYNDGLVAEEEDEEPAAVLPGKAKTQPGLAAKWAHVPSKIRGEKPWQGRSPVPQQPASAEDMVGEDGLPLVEMLYEVGSTALSRNPPDENGEEEEEMMLAAEVFRDQEQDDDEEEDEQWARYAIPSPAGQADAVQDVRQIDRVS